MLGAEYNSKFIQFFISNDLETMEMMIMIYPLLCSPQDLLALLLDNYGFMGHKLEPIQKRISNLLALWSSRYIADFDEKMLFVLRYLLSLITKQGNLPELAKQLLENSKSKNYLYHDFGHLTLIATPKYDPIQPPVTESKKFNWLAEIDSKILAEQFTAIEWNFFGKLEPRDLIQHVSGESVIRNSLTTTVTHFSYITSLVKTLILIQEEPEFRAQVLLKFIRIAKVFGV
jgi:hypothetical protein